MPGLNARAVRWFLAILFLLLGLGLAVGWLVPAVIAGQTPLSAVVKTILRQEKDVRKLLTRSAGGDGTQGLAISALYATPEFFAYSRREDTLEYKPQEALVFFLTETVGLDQLPDQPPMPTLSVDGGRAVSALEQSEELQRWKVVTQSLHQRTSAVRFPRSALPPNAKTIELTVTRPDGSGPLVLRWDLPTPYANDVAVGESLWLGSLLGLVAALLFSHAACLAQLSTCGVATVIGMGSTNKSQVTRLALLFALGFITIYTAAGALAGFVGQEIQSSGLEYNWIAPLEFASGLIVVLLGLWMGIVARAPLLGRIPLPAFARIENWKWMPLLMGSGWALGCVTCFDGIMFPTLLVYTGMSGSVLTGGLILFLFSLGIAIPLLFASVSMRLGLAFVESGWAPSIRSLPVLLSTSIVVGLGISMMTGNFHNVSNLAFQWFRALGLF